MYSIIGRFYFVYSVDMNTLQKLATIGMIITSWLWISASKVQAQTQKSLHEMTFNPWNGSITDTTQIRKRRYDISYYPPNDTANYGTNAEDLKWYRSYAWDDDKKSSQPEWPIDKSILHQKAHPASMPPTVDISDGKEECPEDWEQ